MRSSPSTRMRRMTTMMSYCTAGSASCRRVAARWLSRPARPHRRLHLGSLPPQACGTQQRFQRCQPVARLSRLQQARSLRLRRAPPHRRQPPPPPAATASPLVAARLPQVRAVMRGATRVALAAAGRVVACGRHLPCPAPRSQHCKSRRGPPSRDTGGGLAAASLAAGCHPRSRRPARGAPAAG